MRTIITSIISVGLVVVFADTTTAGTHSRQRGQRDALEYKYPYATRRQLHNERAYERGEYWEHDSSALIPFTRAWLEQKLRESPY